MLVDSHCHLNLIDLTAFNQQVDEVLNLARQAGVERFLCVSVELEEYPQLCQLAEQYPDVYISIGLHPNSEIQQEPQAGQLVHLAQHSKCIAIGETGLDFYRCELPDAKMRQEGRFREHIRAALTSSKPLIIHTRQAAEETIKIMREEEANKIGGVMHCFTESWEVAKRALDLNFYISLSGIVTFKNAKEIHEVATKIPIDRLLIETDSPFLAPVPYRGQQNHPALIVEVAKAIALLRNQSYEEIAAATTQNFYRCFSS